MTNTSTPALISVSPLDFTATSLFLPISLAVSFSLPLAVDPAHYRPPSCLLRPGLSQQGAPIVYEAAKGSDTESNNKGAGRHADSARSPPGRLFICMFWVVFSFTNARSHTGPRGESEVGGKDGALGVGEVWWRSGGQGRLLQDEQWEKEGGLLKPRSKQEEKGEV